MPLMRKSQEIHHQVLSMLDCLDDDHAVSLLMKIKQGDDNSYYAVCCKHGKIHLAKHSQC